MLDFDGCDFKGSSGLLGAHRASASNKAASPLPQLQEAQGSDIPVSQLLLQQSEALKALVSHVANQDGFLDYGAGSASSSFLSSERSYWRIWPPEKEISC